MLGALVAPAVENAHAEAAELEAALVADGEAAPLQPWDWAYYAERVQGQRFDVDADAVRPCFELERVVERRHLPRGVRALRPAVHQRARPARLPPRRAGLRGARRRRHRGSALFLADWYAARSKRGGAWMSTFVDQSHLLGSRARGRRQPQRPPAARREAHAADPRRGDTAFHEFGHVLHGLFSDVRYPRFSGTSVPRDFVEFPSQVNEMWAWWPSIARRYARHHATGEPLPTRSSTGSSPSSPTARASAPPSTWRPRCSTWSGTGWRPARRRARRRRRGVRGARRWPATGSASHLVPPRYRSTYFAHVFAGGYSAGYYAYIWSEVLDADTVEWFREHGGLRRERGRVPRASCCPAATRRPARGVRPGAAAAPPRVEPLLERRGLTPVG